MDWQPVIVAIISAIPPTIGAFLAYRKAGEGKTIGQNNALKIQEVATKTDGMSTALAEATRKEGFGAGVKQEQDATAAAALEAAKQAALIEAIVARVLAAQPTKLVKTNGDSLHSPPLDPGPVAAQQINTIKSTVEDIQPRVVDIEAATVNVSNKVKAIASKTDDRLDSLEQKQ